MCLCISLSLLAAAPALPQVPSFDFVAPPSVADPSTPAVMRDLAARLIPVYQESDPNRYLENLSALQVVAGNIEAAHVSRQTLRDRRRSAGIHGTVSRDVIYDMYVNARAIELEDKIPFPQAFAKSYRDVSSRLNDRNEYTVIHWLQISPDALQAALQAAFDKQSAVDAIGQPAAVDLIWQYFAFDAYRSFAPLVDLLGAEDDRRRYTTDAQVLIPTPDGATVAALVVRPRGAGPLPTLLEFTIDDSPANFARECAAHGYVGVVAYTRDRDTASEGAVPFQHDGDDVRALLGWIADQPWSDGRVGMYGSGYSGFTPWAAAKQPTPVLKAIATTAAIVPGVNSPMSGGIFQNSAYHWSLKVAEGDSGEDDEAFDETRWRALDQKWYVSGVRYRDMGRLLGHPNPLFIRWMNHPSYDAFWRKMIPSGEEFARITIPVLTVAGWYGANQSGDLYYFLQHHRYGPRADHKLLIGPFDDSAMQHGPSPILLGFRPDASAQIDLRELRYEWFDHVLKDSPLPESIKGVVNYEVSGADEWRHAASIEAMSGGSLRLYLEGATLSRRRARPSTSAAAFVQRSVNFADRSDADWMPPNDIVGKSVGATKTDAVFVSEPLMDSTELSGMLGGTLDFTVNKLDLDLHLMVYELQPNGAYLRLFSPAYAFRASYARDRAHRHLLKAGVRQTLAFRSDRLLLRYVKAGSRLVLVLGIEKRADREINYGTGNDVSDESIADASVPLKIRWHDSSFIDLPVRN